MNTKGIPACGKGLLGGRTQSVGPRTCRDLGDIAKANEASRLAMQLVHGEPCARSPTGRNLVQQPRPAAEGVTEAKDPGAQTSQTPCVADRLGACKWM